MRTKFLVAIMFALSSGMAFADAPGPAVMTSSKTNTSQNQNQQSSSVSAAQGGTVSGVTSTSAGGAVSGVTASNGLTVGCLVNCASTDQGNKDLADAQVQSAVINGQTARDVAGTTQTIKNTPSVSGAALTSSNDTCMGSASGSANVPGIGVSFGTSWVDTNCKMLKNARELWNMGMKAAAMSLMCKDPDNKEALELTGYICPTKKNVQSIEHQSSVEMQPTPVASRRSAVSLADGYGTPDSSGSRGTGIISERIARAVN